MANVSLSPAQTGLDDRATVSWSRKLRALNWAGTAIQRFLLVLLALYVIKQLFFVFAFKPFTGHDEVAHFSYIALIATEGRIPVLPELEAWQTEARAGQGTNFDQLPTELYPYCRYAVVGWHCEPRSWQWSRNPPRMVTYLGQLYPTGYQYTANHPPLYYALMTPVYLVSQAWSPEVQQYLLRVAAIPFGLLTVFLAYRMTREVFPNDGFLQVTVPTVVAFQPQISYEAAMVNNDIAAIAFFSWVIFLVVRGVRANFPISTCVWLGVALGLAVLAKSTSLTAIPIIAVAIILTAGWRHVWDWLRRGVLVAVPAAVLVFPWYLFMFRTYGNLDALPQILALQFWNRPAGTFLGMLTDRDFAIMRFRETWGEFGWRLIPLSPQLLWAIAIPGILALVGLCWYFFSSARASLRDKGGIETGEDDRRWLALLVLLLVCVVAYLAVIQFGTQFQLTQARYFFPAVNAAALLTMLGLRTIIPARAHRYAQGVVFAGMVLLNIVIFTQYVLPHFVSG